MNKVAEARGHVVWVRSVRPPLFEAACECGYRSAQYLAESGAMDDAAGHISEAPTFSRSVARRRASQRKK